MQFYNFSKERGIIAIFNGYGEQAYIFHSSFYGFVGYADVLEECGSKSITVELYLCEDSKSWYWSLLDIIKRGIRKCENQFVKKTVDFKVHYLSGYSIGNPAERLKLEITSKEILWL